MARRKTESRERAARADAPRRGAGSRGAIGAGRRLWNLALAEAGWRLKLPRTPGRPPAVVIDPTTACSLSCPLCPTGLGMTGRPRGTMRPEDFRRAVDLVSPWAWRVLFGNWGEPLLHPEIADLIAYAVAAGLRTHLVTNLTALTEDLARALVESGLRHVIVSLDGASEETYARYRIGGSFETVRRNLECLKSARDAAGRSRPRITWQFLVFRHNEHEVEKARALAESMGVEIAFRGGALGGPGQTPPIRRDPELAEKWLSRDPRWREGNDYFSTSATFRPAACWWLWKTLALSWDGSAAPCCCTFEAEHDAGNVLTDGLDAVWNGPAMVGRRSLFARGAPPPAAPVPSICHRCILFRKTLPR